MNIKVLGLLGAVLFAAPLAAVAAPATGLTAHAFTNLATAPQATSDAAVALGDTAKVDKVFWRGRGWRYGYRGYGFRGYGYRGFGIRPFFGFYGRPYLRRRRWVY